MNRQILTFVILILTAGVGFAQDPTPTPTGNDVQKVAPEDIKGVPPIAEKYRSDERALPDLGRIGVDMLDQRPLTLAEALELALQNNRDIEVARKTITSAEFDLRASRGLYQPRFTAQTAYEQTTTPNVSIFSNNQKTNQGSFLANAAVTASLPNWGTQLSANFNNSRLTTDNPISILSPQYNSSLGFSLVQPLFRGRSFDAARRGIEIAKKNISLTDTQFRQRTTETVAAVEKAYWDLTFALRNLQVQRESLRDAKSQLEHNRRLVEEGQLAPIDIVASETQVANFEQAVYEALNNVNLAENGLKLLVSPNRNDRLWSQAITPVDSVEVDIPTITLTEAMDTAMDNRAELAINKTQKDINLLDQRLYKDQKKPQIDLTAGYSSAGIGGSQNPDFSPTFPTACSLDPASPACAQQQANLALLTGSPYRGVFTNRYPTYRVGLNINIPLFGDKTAEAQLGKARVDAEKIDTQREQIEQAIQVEVRNAIQAIRTSEARLRAAAVARENSGRQYESEQRKLDAGQSDVYKVLERQTAYTAARSAELRARTELNKAIAEFERATGTSLKANNIQTK
ncbi:MAG: TolC family protein [Blastocatellia bacterium]|nr:TolC family protein [Blastocatellia bacterium]